MDRTAKLAENEDSIARQSSHVSTKRHKPVSGRVIWFMIFRERDRNASLGGIDGAGMGKITFPTI